MLQEALFYDKKFSFIYARAFNVKFERKFFDVV